MKPLYDASPTPVGQLSTDFLSIVFAMSLDKLSKSVWFRGGPLPIPEIDIVQELVLMLLDVLMTGSKGLKLLHDLLLAPIEVFCDHFVVMTMQVHQIY